MDSRLALPGSGSYCTKVVDRRYYEALECPASSWDNQNPKLEQDRRVACIRIRMHKMSQERFHEVEFECPKVLGQSNVGFDFQLSR